MSNMKRILFTLLLSISSLFFSCSETQKSGNEKIKVIATTGIIGDVLINLLDSNFEVISLMGPGVDPHLYKATQGDLKRLNEADVVVYNGLHLEGKMEEIFERLKQTKTVFSMEEMSPQDRLIEIRSFGGNFDPHIWFDVALWAEAGKNLGEAFARKFPDHKESILFKTHHYYSCLLKLDSFTRNQISLIPESNRVLVTAHDAFEYFGRSYHIEVRGLQGISTMSEAGIRDITNLVDFLVENSIPAVFVETSVSRRAIDAVVEGCNRKGHDILIGGSLYSDALGQSGTVEGTYIGTVKSNVNTIVKALNK